MALNVWVVAPPATGEPRKAFRQHVAALAWDGYYHFLSRYRPPASSGGGAVDLYDSAYFAGDALMDLRAALLKAVSALDQQPSEWQEHLGAQTHPVAKDIYAPVRRAPLMELLRKLLAAVDLAEVRRGRIIFEGD